MKIPLTNSIYRFLKKIHLLESCAITPISEWTFIHFITLFTLVLLPIGLYLYYVNNRKGWFILLGICSFYFISKAHDFLFCFLTLKQNFSELISIGLFLYGFYYITKKEKLQQFKISNRNAFFTLFLSLFLSILIHYIFKF